MSADDHIARIGANAEAAGFERVDVAGFDAAWHRRKFMPSRIGMVDSVVTVRTVDAATAADLVAHEDDAFAAALQLKVGIPRGLGSAVEVHPVTIAASADEGAIAHAAGVMKNRWSTMTMHALIHGTTVTVFEGRKVWGAAYVKSLRKQLAEIVGG